MGINGKSLFLDIDYWIPVPVHFVRRSIRGYNHVDLLFDPYLKSMGVQFCEGVSRVKHTPFLYDLTANQRVLITKNAFSLNRDIDFKGKRVVILDDIITTGGTVCEISRLLRDSGVTYIGVLSLCYVR